MKTKILLAIGMGVVLAGIGGGAFYYFNIQSLENLSERSCVASLFPLVVITHKTREFESSFKDLGKKDESQKALEMPPLITEDIDNELLDVAEKMTSTSPEDLKGLSKEEWLAERMDNIVELFREDAPQYLTECRDIFDEFQKTCGFITESEKSQDCAKQYQQQAQELVSKHFPQLDL